MRGTIGRRVGAVLAAVAVASVGLVAGAGVASAEPIAYAVADGDGGPCQFGTVDLATGAFTAIGAPDEALCVFDLTVGPDGTVYGIRLERGRPSPWSLQTIDPATGAVTDSAPIGQLGSIDGGEGGGVAFTAGGQLYAEWVPAADPPNPADLCTGGAYCLSPLDPADPSAPEIIGPGPLTTQLESLTITCDDAFYVTQEPISDGLSVDGTTWPEDVGAEVLLDTDLATVDPSTGATTVVGPFGHLITGHDVDPEGTLWGVGFITGGPASVFTIDTSSGAATPTVAITGADNGLLAIAIDHPCAVPPTPEPVVVVPTFTG